MTINGLHIKNFFNENYHAILIKILVKLQYSYNVD